jgi:hypothetical protein
MVPVRPGDTEMKKFPDDATPDEVNEFLFHRGLRPCPHSHHSSDEDFAECLKPKQIEFILSLD